MAVSIAVCICAPVAKFDELLLTADVFASIDTIGPLMLLTAILFWFAVWTVVIIPKSVLVCATVLSVNKLVYVKPK